MSVALSRVKRCDGIDHRAEPSGRTPNRIARSSSASLYAGNTRVKFDV